VGIHLSDVILQFACPEIQPVGANPGPGNDSLIQPIVFGQGGCERVAQERANITEFREVVVQLQKLIRQWQRPITCDLLFG
jgi:hypothetical protein